MKSLFLSIFISLLLPCFAQAEILKKKPSEVEKLFAERGELFLDESFSIIHTNLALAVFVSDDYNACLTNDDRWFDKETVIYPNNPYLEKKRKGPLSGKTFCTIHLRSIRKDIKERYPLMRAYMAIAMHDSPEYVSVQDFYGLVSIPDPSPDEIALGEQIFNKNVFASKVLTETGQLPVNLKNDPQVVCAISGVKESEIRQCFHEKYLELFFGDIKKWNSVKFRERGLPLLAFVTSENPSDDELIEGISKIRRNGLELLNDFQRRHGVTMDENGVSSYIDDDDTSIDGLTVLADFFGLWLPRLRTDLDGYQGLREAGVTDNEINKLLSSMNRLAQTIEGTTYKSDYDKIMKIGFYRPDVNRPTYVPVKYLPVSIQNRN